MSTDNATNGAAGAAGGLPNTVGLAPAAPEPVDELLPVDELVDELVERGVALWQQLQHWARVLASPLRPVVEAARSRKRDEARAARRARAGKRPHSSRAPGTPRVSGGLGYDEGNPADPYNYTPPPRARRVAKATAKRRAGGLGL